MKLEFEEAEMAITAIISNYELERGDSIMFMACHEGESIFEVQTKSATDLATAITAALCQRPEMIDIFKTAVVAAILVYEKIKTKKS